MKITKLPWKIHYTKSAPTFSVYASHRQICTFTGALTDEDHANAAHIVKCVNLHDELVKNGEALLEAIENDWDKYAAIDAFRATLAKARGEA